MESGGEWEIRQGRGQSLGVFFSISQIFGLRNSTKFSIYG